MMNKAQYYQAIRDYYAQSNWLYKYVWYAGTSLGLHFGFADHETKNHTEALINQYRYVIEKGKIKRGMKVLDAGCGVGGATIYIAKSTGAEVVGITIVPEQVKEAKKNAKNLNLQVKFVVGDYIKTGFKSNTFDIVFGMESVCYAMPKSTFLKEAYRVLKPGGTLVITDGYRKREVRGSKELAMMKDFCDGWRLSGLLTHDAMTSAIKEAGFEKVKVEDKTQAIQMSLNKMKRLVWWWGVGEIILGWIKIPTVTMARDNAKAMRCWIEGVERGLFGYYAHVAYKPKN